MTKAILSDDHQTVTLKYEHPVRYDLSPNGVTELEITFLQYAAWLIALRYLHYNGDLSTTLSNAEFERIYAKCDGFGKMSIADLRQINDGYDWSHVRDSSYPALVDAAQEIARSKYAMSFEELVARDILDLQNPLTLWRGGEIFQTAA